MSASKIMKRIVSPGSVDYTQNDPVAIASEIHDSTYGISSDPLALFAVVFSALIHDVDVSTLCELCVRLVHLRFLGTSFLTQRDDDLHSAAHGPDKRRID